MNEFVRMTFLCEIILVEMVRMPFYFTTVSMMLKPSVEMEMVTYKASRTVLQFSSQKKKTLVNDSRLETRL